MRSMWLVLSFVMTLSACSQDGAFHAMVSKSVVPTDPMITPENEMVIQPRGENAPPHILGYLEVAEAVLEKDSKTGELDFKARVNLKESKDRIRWSTTTHLRGKMNLDAGADLYPVNGDVKDELPVRARITCMSDANPLDCERAIIDIYVKEGEKIHAAQVLADLRDHVPPTSFAPQKKNPSETAGTAAIPEQVSGQDSLSESSEDSLPVGSLSGGPKRRYANGAAAAARRLKAEQEAQANKEKIQGEKAETPAAQTSQRTRVSDKLRQLQEEQRRKALEQNAQEQAKASAQTPKSPVLKKSGRLPQPQAQKSVVTPQELTRQKEQEVKARLDGAPTMPLHDQRSLQGALYQWGQRYRQNAQGEQKPAVKPVQADPVQKTSRQADQKPTDKAPVDPKSLLPQLGSLKPAPKKEETQKPVEKATPTPVQVEQKPLPKPVAKPVEEKPAVKAVIPVAKPVVTADQKLTPRKEKEPVPTPKSEQEEDLEAESETEGTDPNDRPSLYIGTLHESAAYLFERDRAPEENPLDKVPVPIARPETAKKPETKKRDDIKAPPSLPKDSNSASRPRNQVFDFASRGHLENPSNLTKRVAEGFQILRSSRERHYGSHELMEMIAYLGKYARAQSSIGILRIGDLSQKQGGKIRGSSHSSHQNGLDVDVGFPVSSQEVANRGFYDLVQSGRISPHLKIAETWALFKAAWKTGSVDRIFVVKEIKQALCAHAISKGDLSRDGSGPMKELLRRIRPTPGHDTHFHLRLRCSTYHPRCQMQGDPPTGSGCF